MPSTRQKKEERRRENDINTEKVILCIGQFVPRKGIDILLMSAIHVKSNATLIIIGGEPTDSYLQLVNEHRLNHVRFVDFMDKSDMSAYFSLADIFVLPTREDIWGLVINEAMAEGLPIITTDKCIAGLELVEDNVNGFIIPINEPRLLAEKIDYILTDPKKNESFGQASLHKVKCYTIEEMVARHISLFEYLF